MRPHPLFCVSDVEFSSRWCERSLGARTAYEGPESGRLFCDDRSILRLHSFDMHHGPIGDPADRPYGDGVLVGFEIDDGDAAMARVAEVDPAVAMPRHRNPNVMHGQCWVRDPDGYVGVVASPDGMAP